MASNWLDSFAIALGFEVNTASLNTAKKSIADYEKAVRDAEARVLRAREENAKAEVQIEARRQADRAKTALAEQTRAQTTEKAETEQSRARVERARNFGLAMSRMALAATAAATAISYAVSKVTGSFDNLYFQAQRSGTSVQSLKALGYAFSQTGSSAQDAAALVDSFTTKLRNNPGLRQFVKDLGVDDNLEGAAKVMATVEKLRREPYEVGVQHAEMLGISEERFNHIVRQSDAIKKYGEQYNATTKSFGLNSEQAAASSAAFQRALTRLQASATTLAERLGTQVAPYIERFLNGISDWLDRNPDKIEGFFSLWDNFSTRVVGVANAFEALWKILKKLDDWLHLSAVYKLIDKLGSAIISGNINPGAILSSQFGGGTPGVGAVGGFNPLEGGASGGGGDDRNLWQRHAPKWLGGKEAPAGGIGKLAQGANAKAIIEELKGAGFNDNAIAAVVGSMQTESSLNPGARNGSGHTGLWQWDARKRWPKIEKWIRDQGGDPSDARWQTKAWVAEHSAKPGDALYDGAQTAQGGAMLRNNPSLNDAVTGVHMSERFGPGEEGGRAANARSWLSHLNGTVAPSPSGVTDISSRSNYRGGQMEAVKGFVMHHTAGRGTPESVVDTLNQRGYGVQYVMDRDGKVYQTLPSGARGAHIRPAQNGSGLSNANTLGMEVIAKDDRDITPAQTAAAKAFLEQQQKLYPGLKVFGHGEINGHKQETEGMTIVNAFRAGQAAEAWKKQPQPSRASAPNMTPGGFDVNNINPRDVMKAPPMGAGVGNTSTSNDNRAVHQTFNTTTTINEARNTKEAGKAMEGTFGRMHSMALSNAQSAVA